MNRKQLVRTTESQLHHTGITVSITLEFVSCDEYSISEEKKIKKPFPLSNQTMTKEHFKFDVHGAAAVCG